MGKLGSSRAAKTTRTISRTISRMKRSSLCESAVAPRLLCIVPARAPIIAPGFCASCHDCVPISPGMLPTCRRDVTARMLVVCMVVNDAHLADWA